MKIPFTKMHGAGNDFIMIDDRELTFPMEDRAFIAEIASRRTGIGCDGILLIQPSHSADFRMRFMNPDGREVDMCGNGARCIAKLAHELGMVGKTMSIETGAGVLKAALAGDLICLDLTDPKDLRLGLDANLEWSLDFVNTGVEHAVAWVEDLQAVNVPVFGKRIREHALFSPNGTNANFAQIEDDGSISVRTYERGVEAETLACGTGATAVGLLAAERGWVNLPVTVHCAGGFDLVIDSSAERTTLTGGAVKIFKGTVEYGNRV